MRWLLPLLFSLTTIVVLGLAVLIFVQFKDWLPALVGLVVIGTAVFWILGCVFTPAVADRKCPRCEQETLVRPRKDQMLGVRCENCGFEDQEMYRAYLDEI
jgi:hypothetical protein